MNYPRSPSPEVFLPLVVLVRELVDTLSDGHTGDWVTRMCP